MFCRLQHNKQGEGSDWFGQSSASIDSSRFASDNREWYQWTSRHFQLLFSGLLREKSECVLSPTQPQHCVVTIDVRNSRSVPWNKSSVDLGTYPYPSSYQKTTSTNRSMIHTTEYITLSIRSIHNGRYPAQPDFYQLFLRRKWWICGPVSDGPLWTTPSVEFYGYLQTGK